MHFSLIMFADSMYGKCNSCLLGSSDTWKQFIHIPPQKRILMEKNICDYLLKKCYLPTLSIELKYFIFNWYHFFHFKISQAVYNNNQFAPRCNSKRCSEWCPSYKRKHILQFPQQKWNLSLVSKISWLIQSGFFTVVQYCTMLSCDDDCPSTGWCCWLDYITLFVGVPRALAWCTVWSLRGGGVLNCERCKQIQDFNLQKGTGVTTFQYLWRSVMSQKCSLAFSWPKMKLFWKGKLESQRQLSFPSIRINFCNGK